MDFTTIYLAVKSALIMIYDILAVVISVLETTLFLFVVGCGLLIWFFAKFVPGDEPEKTLQTLVDKVQEWLRLLSSLSLKKKR